MSQNFIPASCYRNMLIVYLNSSYASSLLDVKQILMFTWMALKLMACAATFYIIKVYTVLDKKLEQVDSTVAFWSQERFEAFSSIFILKGSGRSRFILLCLYGSAFYELSLHFSVFWNWANRSCSILKCKGYNTQIPNSSGSILNYICYFGLNLVLQDSVMLKRCSWRCRQLCNSWLDWKMQLDNLWI